MTILLNYLLSIVSLSLGTYYNTLLFLLVGYIALLFHASHIPILLLALLVDKLSVIFGCRLSQIKGFFLFECVVVHFGNFPIDTV